MPKVINVPKSLKNDNDIVQDENILNWVDEGKGLSDENYRMMADEAADSYPLDDEFSSVVRMISDVLNESKGCDWGAFSIVLY